MDEGDKTDGQTAKRDRIIFKAPSFRLNGRVTIRACCKMQHALGSQVKSYLIVHRSVHDLGLELTRQVDEVRPAVDENARVTAPYQRHNNKARV